MAFDFLGNVIFLGSVVTYPSRRSSSLWMNMGMVITINGDRVGVIGIDVWKYPEKIELQDKISYPDSSRMVLVHPDNYNKAIRKLIRLANEKYE